MKTLTASFRDASPRRLLIRILVPALVLFGSACASTTETGGQSFESAAGRVFGIAFQHIRERYIEKVSLERVALSGMTGLSQIDRAMVVRKAKGKVELLRRGKPVAVFKAPAPDDIDGWANLTTALVQASRTYSPELKKASAEVIYKAVFDAALLRLDRYSRYATAEQARENRASRSGFVGIGVRIRQDKGVTKVIMVFPETPAARAGLKAEDAILKVDGVAITGMKIRQVVKRLRGPNGSQVRLTVGRKSAKTNLSINIVRAHVIANTVFLKRESGIAYIRLTRFNQRTSAELARAVRKARRAAGDGFKGVILDLRNNPGGLLDQAVEVSDMFLTGGQIVSTEGRHPGSFQRYSAGAGDIAGGKPLVVLINGRSASSSEIVAAALQDLNRAVLVGSNSFGKGTVQSVFRLPNEGELVLTWSRFHAPSGYTLQDLGVLPTVCTVGLNGDVGQLAAEIRSGRHRTAEALSQWRLQRKPTHNRLTRLRGVCPGANGPRGDAADRDLAFAKRLINDSALYTQSLQLSHTSVAGR
jgi:carboxyl-terminal processing protease